MNLCNVYQYSRCVEPSRPTWSAFVADRVGPMGAVAGPIRGILALPQSIAITASSHVAALKKMLWLVLLACMWGSSYMFVKIGVAEIPPMMFALGRSALGASILFLVLRLQGQHLPGRGGIWKHIAVVALVHNAAPYALVCWGGQHIDSGLAAIITGTSPLFTVLLAHFLVTDDRLNGAKLLGVLVGFAGLVVLLAPTLVSGVQATQGGAAAVLAAAICYAIAFVYSRKHLRGLPSLAAPTAQLMIATVYMVPLMLIVEWPVRLAFPSWSAMGAWLGISLFGTAIAFIVFYRLVETAKPSSVAMVSYLIPIVGLVLGVAILGEQLAWNTYAGFAVVLAGVLIVNGVFDRQLRQRAA